MTVRHGKVSTIMTFYDGEVIREAQELEESLNTDRNSLLKDVIDSISIINTGTTRKLTVEVCVDKHGRYQLTRRWIVNDA